MVDLFLRLYNSDPAFAECPAIDLLKGGKGIKKMLLQFLRVSNLDPDELSLILDCFNRVGPFGDMTTIVILQPR